MDEEDKSRLAALEGAFLAYGAALTVLIETVYRGKPDEMAHGGKLAVLAVEQIYATHRVSEQSHLVLQIAQEVAANLFSPSSGGASPQADQP